KVTKVKLVEKVEILSAELCDVKAELALVKFSDAERAAQLHSALQHSRLLDIKFAEEMKKNEKLVHGQCAICIDAPAEWGYWHSRYPDDKSVVHLCLCASCYKEI